jgi:hypothetical protein
LEFFWRVMKKQIKIIFLNQGANALVTADAS